MAVVLILRTTTETSNVSTDDLFGTSLDVYMRAAYVIDADSSGGGNRNDDKESDSGSDAEEEAVFGALAAQGAVVQLMLGSDLVPSHRPLDFACGMCQCARAVVLIWPE